MVDAGKFLDDIAFDGVTPKAGDYIRTQRKILNFTQEDLASITEIDKANLSSYENNKKEIGIKVAVKIGLALNLDPSILIESSISAHLNAPEMRKIQLKSKKLIKLKSKKVA